ICPAALNPPSTQLVTACGSRKNRVRSLGEVVPYGRRLTWLQYRKCPHMWGAF
ncbi:unnamed protein product, partial [Ectocarpus sp. 12 AP-2014]